MMEHLPPVGWADVATKDDLERLRLAISVDVSALRIEMAEKFNRLLFQLVATMTGFITLVLVVSRIG